MLSKKRRVVSDKTTPKNIQQHELYRNSMSASRVKVQSGELLLCLQVLSDQEQ